MFLTKFEFLKGKKNGDGGIKQYTQRMKIHTKPIKKNTHTIEILSDK